MAVDRLLRYVERVPGSRIRIQYWRYLHAWQVDIYSGGSETGRLGDDVEQAAGRVADELHRLGYGELLA